MRTKVIEGFSCLKMKEDIHRKIRARLKGMTPEEQMAYWNERGREMLAEKRALEAAASRKR